MATLETQYRYFLSIVLAFIFHFPLVLEVIRDAISCYRPAHPHQLPFVVAQSGRNPCVYHSTQSELHRKFRVTMCIVREFCCHFTAIKFTSDTHDLCGAFRHVLRRKIISSYLV